ETNTSTQDYVIHELIQDTISSVTALFPKKAEHYAYCYLSLTFSPASCKETIEELQKNFPESAPVILMTTFLTKLTELLEGNPQCIKSLNLDKLTNTTQNQEELVNAV